MDSDADASALEEKNAFVLVTREQGKFGLPEQLGLVNG